jgi:hypothetical protein
MKIERIILHDRRIMGRVIISHYPQDVPFSIDETIELRPCFKALGDFSRSYAYKKRLDIICHGDEKTDPQFGKYGGTGLHLGKEMLTSANVQDLGRLIRGEFHTIVIFACSAADSSYVKINPAADGRKLMQDLANSSGAVVAASDSTQYYYYEDGIDFKEWEGKLLFFRPR